MTACYVKNEFELHIFIAHFYGINFFLSYSLQFFQ